MAIDIIKIEAETWTLLSKASVSFQVLHDTWCYWKQADALPTGTPATNEPAYIALNSHIYNAYSVDGNLYAWAPQAVEIAVGSFSTQQVILSDQTTQAIEHFLTYEVETVTLQKDIAVNDNTIVLDAFTVGSITGGTGYMLELKYNDTSRELVRFYQSEIVNITDNSPADVTLEVAIPADWNYETPYIVGLCITDSNAVRVSAGAGSGLNHLKMQTSPPDGTSWDLTRLIITGLSDAQPDDSKFLGGTALTWGIFGGAVTDNGAVPLHLVNARTNGDLRSTAYDVTYTTRSNPLSAYGMAMRKTFAGPEKYGVAIRLEGPNKGIFFIGLQDDLSARGTNLQFKVMGHVVD